MDKIELIFNMYKDSVVLAKTFKGEMIKKYNLNNEEIRNVYVRIQNYQINTFGNRLTYDDYKHSSQERIDDGRKARQRKYEKKNKRWQLREI